MGVGFLLCFDGRGGRCCLFVLGGNVVVLCAPFAVVRCTGGIVSQVTSQRR